VEVPADTELRDLDFSVAEDLAGSTDGVVLGVMEAVGVIDVGAELSGECRGRERRVLGSRVARDPREVREGEGLRRLLLRRGVRRFGRFGARMGGNGE
jgi:hypothetical protein